MRFLRNLFGILMILFGIGLFLYPTVATKLLEQQTKVYIAAFEEDYGTDTEEGNEQETEKEDDPLCNTILAYNEKIASEGQADFSDPWSCVVSPISLDGLEDERFGYISIPAMDVELPLYVGASTANMAKGAVILGQTSFPIGGTNTNAVIAAHRGYRGAPFFREIEKLKIGDAVYIRNPWETLTYRVESIDIIGPYDSDKVKIQQGKDMITLLTCHPYRSHGKQRYVVYCVREGTEKTEDTTYDTEQNQTTETFVSSEPDIEREDRLRVAAGILIVLMCAATILSKRRR